MERFRPAPRCSVALLVARKGPRPSRAVSIRAIVSGLIATFAFSAAAPVAAQQISGSASIESDFRLRGYSVSGGRPVASARIGLDSDPGLYVDGSASVVLAKGADARFLGYQVDAGFAKRLDDFWTLDLGIAHNQFDAPYRGGFSYDYTEGYAGVTRGPVSAYVFVSPNYYRHGIWTVYGQLEGSVSPAPDWRLTAHLGSLKYLYKPETYVFRAKTQYDWRVAVMREFGSVEVHAALSGGGPGRQFYYGSTHSRTALTAGASLSF
jgi:uncharacterized protein (TIGR02001 family)